MKHFKIYSIIIAIILSGYAAKSQPEIFKRDCNGTLNIKSSANNKYPYNNYNDFLKNYFTRNDQKYFSKKKDLIRITPSIILDNMIYFKSKDIEVKLVLKDTISLDSYNLEYFYNPSLKSYYGNIFSGNNKIVDSIYYKFNNDSHNGKFISKSLIDDLLNINANELFLSYRPIELFYDKKNKFYCIYISGKLDELQDEYYTDFGSSYIAKIIFSQKDMKEHRIVIPSIFAFSYGWLYCEYFWPF